MLRVSFLLFIFVSCSSIPKKDIHLNPFKTDGCTLYPNGSWLHCCIVHDLAYWAGGEVSERKAADQELGQCVASVSSKGNADRMMEGVQFGGGANNVLPWAWGYGWTKNLGYQKLKGEQNAEVLSQSSSIVPEVREYEARLTPKQMTYILENYQKMIMKREGLR